MKQNRHTMQRARTLIVVVLAGMALQAQAATAPQVVQTIPENGAADVDPGLREIRVVFDQDMQTDGYSFVGSGPQFPQPAGQPRWLDARTCVLPVQLLADHDYVFSVNSARFTKFRNLQGTPAVPLVVTFHTAGGQDAAGAEQFTAEQVQGCIDALQRAVATQYSYRDRRGLDWEELFRSHADRLQAARTPATFAAAAAQLLEVAEDPHVWLQVGEQVVPTFQRQVRPNLDLEGVRHEVADLQQISRAAFQGHVGDDIGYLLLGALDRQRIPMDEIDATLRKMQDAPAMILDLRANAGGDEALAQELAGCFVDAPVTYAQQIVCDPQQAGGFSQPLPRVLAPASDDRPHFRGRVVVLQGRFTMSSAEALVLMMRQVPGCVTMGEPTYGSSGNPRPHDLGCGVTVNLPSWRAMDAAGVEWEGVGIAPDVPVPVDAEALKGADPLIVAARQFLSTRQSAAEVSK